MHSEWSVVRGPSPVVCCKFLYICSKAPIMEKTIHHGRNVKRFREMLGIKQEGLAIELGEDWNQKKISQLGQKEIIEEPLRGC